MRCDYYKTLGLHLNCSDVEVRAAWDKLKREKHPDVLMHKEGYDPDGAASDFIDLCEAYTMLETIALRATHLKWMRLFADKCESCGGNGFRAKLNGVKNICGTCNGAGYVERINVMHIK